MARHDHDQGLHVLGEKSPDSSRDARSRLLIVINHSNINLRNVILIGYISLLANGVMHELDKDIVVAENSRDSSARHSSNRLSLYSRILGRLWGKNRNQQY
jgi:uncharacterized protein with HEPN domain